MAVVPRWARLATLAIALPLLAHAVHRAATQSLTHDEGLTFRWYVDAPLSQVFVHYQANNHVLHSLLAWLSARAFGVSELALRLPALLGAALYLWAARRLCLRLLGGGLALLGLLALCLHPLVLDFFSLARGYGISLALLLLAVERGARGARLAASLALGGAIASNLTLLPAAAGMLLALACLARTCGERLAALALGPLAALALLAAPLAAEGLEGKFFVGEQGLDLSLIEMADRALLRPGDAGLLVADGTAHRLARMLLALAVAPALALLVAWSAARAARRLADSGERGRALLLAGAGLVSGGLGAAAANLLFGLPWPVNRTGLHLVVLLLLGTLLAIARSPARGAAARPGTGLGTGAGAPARAARAAIVGLLVLLVAQQAALLPAGRFALWPLDSGNRAIFARILERQAAHPQPAVSLSCHWYYEPALNYYRVASGAHWMPRIERGFDPAALETDYLVVPADIDLGPLVGRAELVLSETESGTLLLAPGAPPGAAPDAAAER